MFLFVCHIFLKHSHLLYFIRSGIFRNLIGIRVSIIRIPHTYLFSKKLRIRPSKGAVIFKAGYRGGRIFGGVPNYFASSNWGIKNFGKNYKIYDGL